MNGNTNDLTSRINECYGSLSKGQKILATYITDNYDKAVFLTAAKMGQVVGVSESTVVRFATHLGYKGYPEFQKALEEMVRNKLNSIQRMEVTYGRISQSHILETVLQSDQEKIKDTLEHIDEHAFELAVDTIIKAKHIYIVGIRSCAPLAAFMAFYFNLMFENVTLLQTNNSSELFEQMVRISKDDVIIGISFPRYSMRTLKAMEFANMETEYYYDTHNEKVLMLFDGMVDGEDNPELFEDIKEGFVEDYIPLPGQYDINEYRIMEEFIYELPAGKNQDVLARTIQGRGAFRRFKDKLYDLNLEKQWYQYREEAYEKIARQWSERHKIDIVE